MFTRKNKEVLRLEGDLDGKILVLNKKCLNKNYQQEKYQLWAVTGGFGCSPTAHGSAVFATCLADDEGARWDRQDFIGIYANQNLEAVKVSIREKNS